MKKRILGLCGNQGLSAEDLKLLHDFNESLDNYMKYEKSELFQDIQDHIDVKFSRHDDVIANRFTYVLKMTTTTRPFDSYNHWDDLERLENRTEKLIKEMRELCVSHGFELIGEHQVMENISGEIHSMFEKEFLEISKKRRIQ